MNKKISFLIPGFILVLFSAPVFANTVTLRDSVGAVTDIPELELKVSDPLTFTNIVAFWDLKLNYNGVPEIFHGNTIFLFSGPRIIEDGEIVLSNVEPLGSQIPEILQDINPRTLECVAKKLIGEKTTHFLIFHDEDNGINMPAYRCFLLAYLAFTHELSSWHEDADMASLLLSALTHEGNMN